MARTGTITLNLIICTDLDCVRAGHPDHPAARIEWPSGRIEPWPELQHRADAHVHAADAET